MALKITDNFDHTSDQPNFKRDQFTTIAEMKACTVCDDGHLSYCKEDGKRYRYDSTKNDNVTGHFILCRDEDRIYEDKIGMGYVILDKYDTFEEQITSANTIYEIRHDFNLGGASVTVPSGCVLKFNGGILSNGTLIGNETSISCPLIKIFETSLSLSGSWTMDLIPQFYGAKGDGTTDDTDAVQAAVNTDLNVTFIEGTYLLGKIELKDGIYDFSNSVIKFKDKESGLFAFGALKTTASLSTSYTANSKEIEISGLDKGDLIVIKDTTIFNPDRVDTYYCGGTNYIVGTNGSKALLLTPFVCDISTDAEVKAYKPCKAVIKNIKDITSLASDSENYLISFRYCVNSYCENVNVSNRSGHKYGIQYSYSMNCKLIDINAMWESPVDDSYEPLSGNKNEYFISIDSSTNISTIHSSIKSTWHCISVTGQLPCINSYIGNCMLLATSRAAYLDHANGYNTTLENCTLGGGAEIDNCGTIRNCIVTENYLYCKLAARGNELRSDNNFYFQNIKIKTSLWRAIFEFSDTEGVSYKYDNIYINNVESISPIAFTRFDNTKVSNVYVNNADVYMADNVQFIDKMEVSNSNLTEKNFVAKVLIFDRCKFNNVANTTLDFRAENTILRNVSFSKDDEGNDIRFNLSMRGESYYFNVNNSAAVVYSNKNKFIIDTCTLKQVSGSFLENNSEIKDSVLNTISGLVDGDNLILDNCTLSSLPTMVSGAMLTMKNCVISSDITTQSGSSMKVYGCSLKSLKIMGDCNIHISCSTLTSAPKDDTYSGAFEGSDVYIGGVHYSSILKTEYKKYSVAIDSTGALAVTEIV